MFLVAGVEGLEDVLADELIVGVEVEYYGVGTAVVVGGSIDVFEGGFPVFVFDVGVGVGVDLMEGEVFAVEFVGVVGGGVVDDDYKVVGIVLLEDGVEVILYSELSVVVVARHHHAHRKLLLVLAELPNLVDPLPLLRLHPFLLFLSGLVHLVVERSQVQPWEVLLVRSERNALLLELFAELSAFVVVQHFFNSK